MSAGNTAFKWYKELPPWAKGAIIVGGAAVTYFALRGVWKIVKRKFDNAKLMRETSASKDQLKDLEKEGVRPTLNAAQLEGMCNSLVSAFAGCGTDEGAIYAVFEQMENDADVYALIAKYGTRTYDACNWSFDFGDTTKTLTGAISDELDSAEKKKVNKILSSKGIEYQFT